MANGTNAGGVVEIREAKGFLAGNMGRGSVHHVAFRAATDEAQAEMRRKLVENHGIQATEQIDRNYFRSIYFREPGGIIFEIATDQPGFAIDEPVASLGQSLMLPPFLEGQRKSHRGDPAAFGERSMTTLATDVIRAGAPISAARAAVILVHGRGASAEGMLGLADAFGTQDVAYVAPQAPSSSWYPYSFMAPISQNEPHLSDALDTLASIVDELDRQGMPSERIVLLGFSQGACLALEFAARNARRYGGVVGLSGGLIGPEATPRNYSGSLAGTPVFLGCSDVDSHIPLSRVHESDGSIT